MAWKPSRESLQLTALVLSSVFAGVGASSICIGLSVFFGLALLKAK